ncbi:exodeoxyribonuclease III [Synechococcus sp. RSCCF101]|uniref:exodeoxyribonuclease III n=1 Tax=Synechococcus sp. RSCCF101 TaxID=2511069 RepID=UPI00177EC105|nr:exodeoxyribonuclease III [Synechococcus sp. RSCCF101]
MQIATWNVNSIRTRLPHVLAWLDRCRPEVLCLQETKVENDRFPTAAFEALGYSVGIHGQKTYNGVAILSRPPIESLERGFRAVLAEDPETIACDEQARVLSACIDGLRVVNLYVPNGSSLQSDKYAYKLRWLAQLRRYLERQSREPEPLCVVGDFNIAPDARDLPDPDRQTGGIMASDAERQALQLALQACGDGEDALQDGFRAFEPGAGHWSWWDYRSGAWDRDRGWRIDHIYLDAVLLAQASGCSIDRQERGRPQPSDHAPVIVTLSWPPAGGDEEEWLEDQPLGWET